ncbi:Glucose-methanol-choline oxidoreductase [Artemisia annua]|uniref:Glucose-methanol-choline oxidoreductase n=1 Tax=Artemisia annua TaxID=35608 RepID=A0A2U1PH17_ARTAN|nr:Glucose-methanol-choline oxidoreductase [Artemisia annua]
MTISFLKDVNSEKDRWTIKVKVVSLWKQYYINSNPPALASMDMIFKDEQGTTIHATIRAGFISDFDKLLQENADFLISNFNVKKNVDGTKLTPHQYKLHFVKKTNVRHCQDFTCDNEDDGLQLLSFQDFNNTTFDTAYAFDVIGRLINNKDITILNGKNGTPYATFAKDSTKAPKVTSYDYIIVGVGTSGCALAATLSQGAKVLVLERANLGPTSPSQTLVSTDGVVNHRARVLGGGSALNAGFFTEAEPDFINEARLDPKLVWESYQWVAKKVEFEPKVLAWPEAVRDGLLEADREKTHGCRFARVYADPSNIAVYLNATVHRILFKADEPKAIGVLYKDKKGKEHTAVLNEGSLLNEPVGQGLSDNPMNIVIVPTTQTVEISLIEVVGITRFGSYIESLSTHINLPFLRKYGSQCAHFVNMTTNIDEIISIIGRCWNLDLSRLNVGVIVEKVTDPRDLQTCVRGMETIINVLESTALSKFRDPFLSVNELLALVVALPLNLRPRHINAPFNLEQYCKDTVMTIWHYHGGCQVGRVVDYNYKVVGVGALRVIDSSTLLSSQGTNPQATIMMLGKVHGCKNAGRKGGILKDIGDVLRCSGKYMSTYKLVLSNVNTKF